MSGAAYSRISGSSCLLALSNRPLVVTPSRCARYLSQSSPVAAADEEKSLPNPSVATETQVGTQPKPTRRTESGSLSSLGSFFSNPSGSSRDGGFFDISSISSDGMYDSSLSKPEEPHHFHVYSTKHNTHITFTRPDRNPVISVSTGNIGFKKAARRSYDAAFQLASYVMARMQESGLNAEIKQMEVVLRGFGEGREAVTKALLGTEGKLLRGKIVRVADATRLKIGGTRGRKIRRL